MPPLDPPPLDTALRTALRSRADALPPLADPFAGVEHRARRIRRRRAAAAVTGTALAVLVVAGAVPLLTPDRAARPGPSDVAASAPPSPGAVRGALDLEHPWAYRGTLRLDDERDGISAAWRAAHPAGDRLVPLFGQVDEPSGQPEVVVLDRSAEDPRWGVLVRTAGRWGVAYEHALDRPVPALVAALPGDGAPRLLAVAAPGTDWLGYDATGRTQVTGALQQMSAPAPGVGLIALQPGDATHDAVVGVVDGGQAWRVDAPDLERSTPSPAATTSRLTTPTPSNVLSWPTRGTPDDDTAGDAVTAYAAQRRVSPDRVGSRLLLVGSDDTERRYLVGQFWVGGDDVADTFAVVEDGSVVPQLYRPLDEDTDAVALSLGRLEEQSPAQVVVVPRPGTALVQYSPDGSSPFRPVGDAPYYDGDVVARPDAAERAGTDRIRLLDGDGRVTATLRVFDLLCGTTSCG